MRRTYHLKRGVLPDIFCDVFDGEVRRRHLHPEPVWLLDNDRLAQGILVVFEPRLQVRALHPPERVLFDVLRLDQALPAIGVRPEAGVEVRIVALGALAGGLACGGLEGHDAGGISSGALGAVPGGG